MELSFSQLVIPQLVLAHLIVAEGDIEHVRTSVLAKLKFDQDGTILFLPLFYFHLLFIQIHHEYYLAMTDAYGKIPPLLKIMLHPSHKCPHIRESVDKRISSFPRLRRVKYYHMVCKQQLSLPCFHDEETLMCLCSEERHANCFHFDFNITYDCDGSNDCQNGAKCFYDNDECPIWTTCVCPECFFGSKCELSTKGFGLSLDIILSLGLLNSILFTFKFIFLMLSQMAYVKNRTFLNINCISMDFLLRSYLTVSDWLNAIIAIERAVTIMKGTSFNKKKSRQTAPFILIMIVLIVFGSNVHDPIYRRLVEEEEDKRIWCIIQYDSIFLESFNATMKVFHFILPFAINIVSALIIIIAAARQRASIQKQLSYKQHLKEQWRHHNHLLISSMVPILLAVPQLIISFLSGCMKSTRNPWLFLTGYFISYVPPLLTVVIYILPSDVYKKQFDTLIKPYQTALWRLLGLK